MDRHVIDFFKTFSEGEAGSFHEVISLNEKGAIEWKEAIKKAPTLPRGWYELAHLSLEDRLDMVRDFWLAKLPFCPSIIEKIDPFFHHLDDLAVFIAQRSFDDPFTPVMIYSLKDNGGFFRGLPPASEDEIISLQKEFPATILPEDYMGFFSIHSGFAKASDSGLFPAQEVREKYDEFCILYDAEKGIFTPRGALVEPKALIPFYQSFGMPFYQCFWSEWYPEAEMGNVYYSSTTGTISIEREGKVGAENMAFASFFDWLVFYLETI
jgi:hypothetical protein